MYEDQSKRGVPNAMAVFNYAHALIKSTKEDVRTGILLLEALLKRFDSDIPKRDYVYYLAIAHTRIKVTKTEIFIIKTLLVRNMIGLSNTLTCFYPQKATIIRH